MNRRLELVAYGEPMILTLKAIPSPPAEGLVVKVAYCGVCRSDVNCWERQVVSGFTTPIVLGHEISGTIYSVGEIAARADPSLRVGTEVIVYPCVNCNKCGYCRHGNQHCPETLGLKATGLSSSQKIGFKIDGGRHMIKVEGVSLVTACLAGCSGVTAFSAVMALKDSVDEAVRVKEKSTVLLVGAGGLSLWAMQFLKNTWGDKVKVVVVDILEEKLLDARKAGADVTLTWDTKEPAEVATAAVQEACGGLADGVIDFTGLTASAERLFYCLNTNSTWVIVGLSGGVMPSLPLTGIALAGIRIHGIAAGTKEQVQQVLELLKQGTVKPPPITTITLEKVNETFLKVKCGQQKGRAVVKFC